VVPKLVGKTLAAARKLLAAAHCTLGKVTEPNGSSAPTLLVSASSPKAGTVLVSGAKVDVKLRAT
jgi:beta-lactam-binding protein with PASTA domain